MSRQLSALILLAIFAGLGAFIYFSEVRPSQEAAQATPTPSPRDVFTLEGEQFNRLALSGGGQRIVAERSGTDWQFLEPRPGPAENFPINSAFISLENLRAFRQVSENDPEVAKYGLADPIVSVEFRTEAGAEYGLAFGDLNVDGQYRFAKRLDSPAIYLVQNDTFRRFESLLNAPPYQSAPAASPEAGSTTPSG